MCWWCRCELQNTYRIAKRCLPDGHFFEKRYEQIRNFEEYLYENSYRVVKIFLNVSKKEQKKRFLERIDDEGEKLEVFSRRFERARALGRIPETV